MPTDVSAPAVQKLGWNVNFSNTENDEWMMNAVSLLPFMNVKCWSLSELWGFVNLR